MQHLRKILVSSNCIKWAVYFEFEESQDIEDSIVAIFSDFDICVMPSRAITAGVPLLKITNCCNGSYVISVNDEHLFYPDDIESLRHWIYEICFHHICLSVEDVVFLHGGAIRIPDTDKCILFFAPTHGGKTTVVTEAVLNGYEYLSDDILPIQVNTRMIYPFPKAAMIRNLDLFHDKLSLKIRGALRQDSGDVVRIVSLFDSQTNREAPYKIELCVFLNRDSSLLQGASVSVINKNEKFLNIFSNIRDPRKMKDNIKVCSEIVRANRFVRLTYSEMTDAIKCVNQIVTDRRTTE